MTKDKSKILYRSITIYFIIYILWYILSPKSISSIGNNVLSILGCFTAILILFKCSNKISDNKSYFLNLAIVSLIYLLGNIFLSIYQFFIGNNIPKFSIYLLLYLVNNLFLFFAMWVLVIRKSPLWFRLQLAIDIIVFSTFFSYVSWFIGIKDVIPYSIYFDSYYFINATYICYNILNILYPILLLLLSYSIYNKTNKGYIFIDSSKSDIQPIAPQKNMTFPILFLYIMVLILSYKNIAVAFTFTLLTVTRQTIYKYIYTYVINKHLTYKYISLTEDLEKKVEERTSELKKKNEELYVLANIDPLTSLPNRRNFVSNLDNLIAKRKNGGTFALLFIDLDRFKSINDWYGHDIGDLLLIATSQRLKYNLSSDDFLARQGGDEFVVLIDNVENKKELINKAYKLVEAFRIPFKINGLKVSSSISVGISMYPINGTKRIDLMKYADIALYSSKSNGKNTFSLYNASMKVEENRKLEIENKLFDSINNNELELYYQPQVNISDESLIGVEALLRWKNPDLGMIPPSEFITIAEDNGFIINIGDWVIEESCKKIKCINEKYDKDIKIGINVSPKHFLASNLVHNIKNCIKKYNLKGSWIDIEITETCSIKNEEKTLEKLKQLKDLGVNISIDDFGIGYSSLSYLKRYPIDTLKIAMELTRGINSNLEDYKIVKAIISMCGDLNLNTIAEGIEDEEQVNMLRELGCKEIQGYYYGKPMRFEELESLFFEEMIMCN